MIVTRQHDIKAICAELRTWKERGYDTETTGLGADDRVFAIIVSNGTTGFYFNFNPHAPETPPETVLPRKETCDALAEALGDEDTTTFIQNAKFDLRMSDHEGIRFTGEIHCTEAIERVVRNNYFGKKPYSLAANAERRGWKKDNAVEEYITKHKLYRDVQVPGKKKPYRLKFFDQVPFPIMTAYALQDAHLHFLIGKDQQKSIVLLSEEDTKVPSLQGVFENEKRLTKVCYRMERAGIKIDRAYVQKALDYEIEEIAQAKRAFCEITGDAYSDSRRHFITLFDRLGEKYPLTDKGNPSFAADVLEEMTTPAAGVINRIRYHEKRASTYYSSFLHFANKFDIIHANARQGGTETGRFSYSDPNLQNVPKEDEEEDQETPFHVRTSFVPEDGQFFYSIDYEQMEYRMMLDYAGEMELIKAVMDGEDVHAATARLCGITRKQAKTLNFALLYGAGIDKIAKMLGVPRQDARYLKELYFGKLLHVQRFMYAVKKSGEGRGFIFNWIGRRCHIADQSWAYVLPNHLIQGGCADVVKIAMVRIEDRLRELRKSTTMRLQVHDELLFSTPFGEERVVEEIVPIMENVYKSQNGMKLKVSVDHSIKSWGFRDKIKGVPYGKIAS